METQTTYEALKELPIFDGMPHEHLAYISDYARHVSFKKDDFIIYVGKPATLFYLIREGHVALEMEAANKIVTLQTVGEGNLVGWSWLVPPYTWHYDARAVTPVSAICFDAASVRKHCEDDPAFGYEVLQRFTTLMVDRLMATRLQLADLYH